MIGDKWRLSELELPDNQSKVVAITPNGDEQEFWFERGLWFFPDRTMYVYFTPFFWKNHE